MARQSRIWRRHQSHEWRHLICSDPKILGGEPVIKGTLLSVSLIVRCAGAGMTLDEVMREYRLTRIQVLAALAYSAEFGGEDRSFPLLA